MTKDQIAQQMRQIDSLFTTDVNKNKTQVNIESKRDYKCDVHGNGHHNHNHSGSLSRRTSNASTLNKRDSITASVTSINKKGFNNNSNGIGIGVRRESMPSLNSYSNYYNRIYEPIKNSNLQKEIEHPSDFPSSLRKSSITKSQNYLRSSTPTDYGGSVKYRNNNYLTKSRESINKFSNDKTKLNKRNSFCGDLRGSGSGGCYDNNNLGSSLYLRRDSSGNTNLIRRDSIGSSRRSSIINIKDIIQPATSPPATPSQLQKNNRSGSFSSSSRDYVKTPIATTPLPQKSTATHEITSILRKSSINRDYEHRDSERDEIDGILGNSNDEIINTIKNKENFNVIGNNLLTKENLKKHVTLLETTKPALLSSSSPPPTSYNRYNRRRSSIDSIGSIGTGNRRVSIDSLEMRRNSWDRRESETSSLYDKVNKLIHF